MTPQNKGKAEVTAVLINVNFYLILLVVITVMENVFLQSPGISNSLTKETLLSKVKQL